MRGFVFSNHQMGRGMNFRFSNVTRPGGRALAASVLASVMLIAGFISLPSEAQESDKALVLLPIAKPDLEVTSFRITGTISSQASIAVAWGVRNSSQKAISSQWVDKIYVSSSKSSLLSSLVAFSAPSPRSLAAATGYTRSIKLTLPRLTSGTYFVWLVTDADGELSEESETNNSKLYGPVAVSTSGIPPRVLPELDTVYVSATRGDDDAGMGTLEAPLKGLDAAITHAASYATDTRRVGVRLGAGIYDSAVTLPSNVEILGSNPFDPGESVIQPSVTKMKANGGTGLLLSGEKNVVRDVTIQVDPKAKGLVNFSLVQLDNAKATLDNVVLNGSKVAGAIGMEALSEGANESTLTRCVFKFLEHGLETFDSGPNITRCVFRDISGDAILVRGSSVKAVRKVPVLGISSDLTTGYNVFENVGGLFINNQTSELLLAENNFWNGFEFDLLDDFFNGPTDFDPPVTTFSLQSAVLVSVVNDEDDEPIYDASVTLEPNSFPPFSENVDGVYSFPICPPGAYTVSVTAPGFFAEEEFFEVAPGATITEVVVRMTPDGADVKVLLQAHSSDANADETINLSELLRVTQLYNAAGVRCLVGSEDGYAPGVGDKASCPPHAADYNSTNWKISLSELLRTIQLFQLGSYHLCDEGEDGFCPGPS